MSKLAQLREEREDLALKARTIHSSYPGGAPMPAKELADVERFLNRIEAIDVEIRDMHDRMAAEGGGATPVLRGADDIRRYYRQQQAHSSCSRPDGSTLADFVRGVAGMPTTESIRAALSEGTDTAGGYAVPAIVMPGVLEAMAPASAVLTAGAGIIPSDQGAKNLTQAAIDTIPTAAWRLENGSIAESDPTFRAVVATPYSLAFYFKVSRELLADASNVTPALELAIGQAFAKALDRTALRGTGVNPEPRGLLNTAGVQSVTNGTNGASLASTKYANLLSAVQKILEADAPAPTAAIMSPRSQVAIGGLVDANGQPLQAPKLLAGMLHLSTTQIPNNLTVGASSDCSEMYVGDFTRMAFMMRERLSIQKVDQLFATTGQLAFVCHVRADVMVQYPKAFALVTGVRP